MFPGVSTWLQTEPGDGRSLERPQIPIGNEIRKRQEDADKPRLTMPSPQIWQSCWASSNGCPNAVAARSARLPLSLLHPQMLLPGKVVRPVRNTEITILQPDVK